MNEQKSSGILVATSLKTHEPMVPSKDGAKLVRYTGTDKLTVNGELGRLANNVSFGHGILSGNHWRSDTDYSMLLGEAVTLRVLRPGELTYKEPFAVKLTNIDGPTVTLQQVRELAPCLNSPCL